MRELTDIMKDQLFWSRLEFVASGWLASSSEKELRRFWVDGFIPVEFRRTNAGAEIVGVSWVAEGSRSQSQYRFHTCLPWRIVNRSREEFEIQEITFDHESRALELRIGKTEANKPVEPMPLDAARNSTAYVAGAHPPGGTAHG